VADRAGVQLDLFEDSRHTVLVSYLREALADRRTGETRRLLAELRREAPRDPTTDAFQRLADAQAALGEPVSDPSAELVRLERTLEPAARMVLAGAAGDYLAAHWRRLAQALRAAPFDPHRPHLHRTFAAARAGDWEAVRTGVEAEPGWREQPVLVRRRAQAGEALGARAGALEDWYRLCWDFPAQAAEALAASQLLAADWARFEMLDPPLETEDFPAWLALRGRTRGRRPENVRNTAALRAMEIAEELHARRRVPPERETLARRRALRELNPRLFERYMADLRRA